MSDELNQTKRLLMRELLRLGQQILSFVLRATDADTEQKISPEEEWRLGRRLVETGRALQQQVEGHAKAIDTQPSEEIIDND